MNLKLSIIIPFYGNADKKLLDHCIQTILHQDGLAVSDYELIIADGSGKGPGAGAARNEGINKAQGEYILFVDADDYLFPNTLNSCLEQAITHKPDIVSFGFSEVTSINYKTKTNQIISFDSYTSGAEYMLHHNFTGTVWRHLFKREYLLRHQLTFSEGIYHEDEEFLAKAYFFATGTFITGVPVYAYYQHPHSIMHKNVILQRTNRTRSFRQILYQLQDFRQKHKEASAIQQKAIERRIHFLTIDYFIQLRRNRSSFRTIRKEMKDLIRDGFLPLPAKKYSWKYSIARTTINLFTHL